MRSPGICEERAGESREEQGGSRHFVNAETVVELPSSKARRRLCSISKSSFDHQILFFIFILTIRFMMVKSSFTFELRF